MNIQPARLSFGKALLCCGVALHTGMAVALPVLETTARVTLGYRLIDNNPGDGIAPTLTFEPSAGSPLLLAVDTLDGAWDYRRTTVAGDVFGASGSYSPVSGASVDKAGSLITTHDQLDADKFAALTAGPSDAATTYLREASLNADQRFTLSAHTTVEVFATFDVETSVDKDAVLTLIANGVPGIDTVLATTTGSLSTYFVQAPGFTVSNDAYHPLKVFETAGVFASRHGTVQDTNVPSSGLTFLLSATNGNATAQGVTLAINTGSGTRLSLNTTPVPEPSALWLSALGLGGLLWAARRGRCDAGPP